MTGSTEAGNLYNVDLLPGESFLMSLVKQLVAIVAVLISCATVGVAQTPGATPSAGATPTAPPDYACKDAWSQKDGKWVLGCETGFCGAGGNGEVCSSTGKTKEGKPTCECKAPSGGNTSSCVGRRECGGDCKNWRGQPGKCELGAGIGSARICQCSSSGLKVPSVLTAIPSPFGR